MNRKLSLTAIFVAASLAAACGKKEEPAPTPAAPAPAPAAQAPAPAPAAGGEMVVRIGHVGPVSGPQAHYGKDNENGSRMAIEDLSTQNIEIGGMIEAIRSVSGAASQSVRHAVDLVQTGVGRADDASRTIVQIGEQSQAGVRMVEEIATSIREQSSASNDIARHIERIAEMAEESSAAARDSAESAQLLDRQASAVREAIVRFKV